MNHTQHRAVGTLRKIADGMDVNMPRPSAAAVLDLLPQNGVAVGGDGVRITGVETLPTHSKYGEVQPCEPEEAEAWWLVLRLGSGRFRPVGIYETRAASERAAAMLENALALV